MFVFTMSCEESISSADDGIDDGNNETNLVEDCAGILGGENICGCANEYSFNYDSDVTYDDGSCLGIEGTWKVTQYRQIGGVWQNATFDREYKFISNIFTQHDAGVGTSTLYYCYSNLTNYLTLSTSSSNTDCTTCYPNSSSRWSWVIATENINTVTIALCDGFAFYKIERQ